MIKDENYINLQGWMVTKLGLRGQELVCYALIYGFSQDGQSKYSGSSSYIAEWLKITKHAAREVLKKLVNKGLLVKHDKTVNGVKLCDYTAVIPGGSNNDVVGQKDTGGWVENVPGVGQKHTGGGSKTYPHNNIDNNLYINNNKLHTADKAAEPEQENKPKPKKLNKLQEFSNAVIDQFENLENKDQIAVWFKRNCRCLTDILRFCGGDIPTAVETIRVCVERLEKAGLTGGYEAVCRNLPEYYQAAKKRLNGGAYAK